MCLQGLKCSNFRSGYAPRPRLRQGPTASDVAFSCCGDHGFTNQSSKVYTIENLYQGGNHQNVVEQSSWEFKFWARILSAFGLSFGDPQGICWLHRHATIDTCENNRGHQLDSRWSARLVLTPSQAEGMKCRSIWRSKCPPTARPMPPERGNKIFQKFCVFSSALEASLCKGIAFGVHPWEHILWHEKYTII